LQEVDARFKAAGIAEGCSRRRRDRSHQHATTAFRGALPSAQPVASPSISPHAPLAATAQHLLGDTDAADRAANPAPGRLAAGPRRYTRHHYRQFGAALEFEIPFATPAGHGDGAVRNFARRRRPRGRSRQARVAGRRFSLDVEPQARSTRWWSLVGNKTAVRMWAERPATAAQLRAGAAQLSQALGRAELTPGDIVIRDGAPAANARRPAPDIFWIGPL